MINPEEFSADLAAQYAEALKSGALEPIVTTVERITDAGAPFSLRTISSLERKAREPKRGDPFEPPYDPGLFVGEVSDTHVCILNKYPVIERHALLITKESIQQEELLDHDDFAALVPLLFALDGIAFYNSGPAAGASQAHKHLQLIPSPLDGGPDRAPLEKLITTGKLPFLRAVGPMSNKPDGALANYLKLRAQLGLRTEAPYNLLATRDWMMLVPRKQEFYEGVSINALAFAGAFLAKDAATLERLKAVGPMRALAEVSGTGFDRR